MLRIGQKLVCVKLGAPETELSWRAQGFVWPVLGSIYTLRGFAPPTDCLSLLLNEIRNPLLFGAFEPGYEEWGFRPVVERKTDISVFQAMLTPSPVTVDAMNISDHAREIVR